MQREDLITFREHNPDTDMNFIIQTFLLGLYYGDTWFSYIKKSIFMENYHDIAKALILRSEIKIACLKEDPNVILGYSLYSKDEKIVHWIYCKKAWRKIGLGRSLFPSTIESTSHISKLGKDLIYSKFNNKIIFNPFNLGV